MVHFGIHDALFYWIKSFLTNRSQSVVVESSISRSYNVISGVPQGSVLGPILFLLFVNDIIDIFDESVICKLFADDVKIYTVIENFDTVNPLQTALSSLCNWSKIWQLSINVAKCNLLHLGKNNPNLKYDINNVCIEASEHVRDLGIEIENFLRFDVHISNVIKRAYQRLAILFKGFVSRDIKLLKKSIYCLCATGP